MFTQSSVLISADRVRVGTMPDVLPSELHRLRPLGRTGLTVTPLGLGGAWLGRTGNGYDDGLASATVHRALKRGINLIDTSAGYGESERRIGSALEQWYAGGGRREDIVLCTKTGTRDRAHDYSGPYTRDSVQRSLELLRTDHLNVVHIHDPPDLDGGLAPGGALDVLEEMKADGLVQAIGLGVRSHEMHRRFIATGRADVVLTYGDYNLLDQSAGEGVLKPAAQSGVGVVNGMAVMYGLLAGGDPEEIRAQRRWMTPEQVEHTVALRRWARERETPLLAVALQFCTREPRIACTLVGCATPEEVDADVDAVLHPLPEAVWAELAQV